MADPWLDVICLKSMREPNICEFWMVWSASLSSICIPVMNCLSQIWENYLAGSGQASTCNAIVNHDRGALEQVKQGLKQDIMQALGMCGMGCLRRRGNPRRVWRHLL